MVEVLVQTNWLIYTAPLCNSRVFTETTFIGWKYEQERKCNLWNQQQQLKNIFNDLEYLFEIWEVNDGGYVGCIEG